MKQQEPCNDCGKTHPYFECTPGNKMDNKTQERIKADAHKYCKGVGNSFKAHVMTNAYIAGATAEHDRSQVLVDALRGCMGTITFWYEVLSQTEGFGIMESEYLEARNQSIKRIEAAIKQWKGKEEVELSCMVCGTKFMGPEPQMCCSGRDCGCMGLPVEPIVCSKECYDKGIPPQKGGSGVIEIN